MSYRIIIRHPQYDQLGQDIYPTASGSAGIGLKTGKGKTISGSAGVNLSSRLITLRGTGVRKHSLLTGVFDTEDKQLFLDDGWNLVAFEISATDLLGWNKTFNIKARVLNSDSNEDARQRAIQLLSENHNNVRLSIVNEQKSINETFIPNNNQQNPQQNPLDYLANALNPTTLFGTTGVTVGVVAAILVLVVVLKNR